MLLRRFRRIALTVLSALLLASQPIAVSAAAGETEPRGPVRGIYVPAPPLANAETLAGYLSLLDRTELNAMVVDVKDDFGRLTYQTANPAALAAGARYPVLGELSAFAAKLHEHGVYAIGRVVVFKDSRMAAHRPDWAILKTGGGVWENEGGEAWLNPYNPATWDYLVEVALEIAAAGFDEVQFDYVRFPTDGDVDSAVYPGKDDRTHRQVIAEFLAHVRQKLEPTGVRFSADIFGMVTTYQSDFGIGQYLEELAPSVHILSPMLYPSHWERGNLNLPNPDRDPYQTILRSLWNGRERLLAAGLTATVIRPFLQDFDYKSRYGAEEVRAQIQATYDAGYDEWLLWNAAGVYTEAALQPEQPPPPRRPELLESGEVGPVVSLRLNGRAMLNPHGDVAPFIARSTGRTLVPLRLVSEALGASVRWDQATWKATVVWRDRTVELTMGKPEAKANGRPVPLDQPAAILNGRTLVPLRFLAEAFGASVGWSPSGEVSLTLPGAECQPGFCQD